jgi:hypothetical protein
MYNQGTASSIKENGLEFFYLDASQQLESILKRERLTVKFQILLFLPR